MADALRWCAALAVCLLLATTALRADTLIFTNGDELTGTLLRADVHGCVFASNLANQVTVPWENIRELRTSTPFVVVDLNGKAHEGTLLVENASLIVSSTSTQPEFLASSEVRLVVDPKTYVNAITAHPAPWQSWRGQITGGFSQVSATQSSISYTTQAALQRPVPRLDWLPQKSNTLLHFQGTYGRLSQPGAPTVRTSIFSAGLEQDQNVSQRLYVFGNAQFDHNAAQGLQLQQAYGGGLGWKVLRTAATDLDLKADLHWTNQRFNSAPTERFLASSFTESMRHNYGKLIWTQSVSLTPSYTSGLAYQMSGLSAWAIPVYKMLSVNFTVIDDYINNPQPGFLKNSLQYSTGLQVSLH
ncbi:MAG TPA: DUF481 domain-containing protein [Terriglobales bacterium]|nr:DUF481 domain-containing protein [Terriglobales bacterium]